jgi:glutaredoxin
MFLDQHNIAYQDFDVAADSAAREEMVKKTGQMAVPVIVQRSAAQRKIGSLIKPE